MEFVHRKREKIVSVSIYLHREEKGESEDGGRGRKEKKRVADQASGCICAR